MPITGNSFAHQLVLSEDFAVHMSDHPKLVLAYRLAHVLLDHIVGLFSNGVDTSNILQEKEIFAIFLTC